MTATILALDLSSRVGWAACDERFWPAVTVLIGAHTERPEGVFSGVKRIGLPACSIGAFCDEFERWLNDMIRVHQPDVVVFEAPILTGGKTSIDTARKLMALAAMTEMVTHRAGIARTYEVNVATVKKYWTGNGHAKKHDMIAAARARNFEPHDDNEADALALLHFAADEIARRGKPA